MVLVINLTLTYSIHVFHSNHFINFHRFFLVFKSLVELISVDAKQNKVHRDSNTSYSISTMLTTQIFYSIISFMLLTLSFALCAQENFDNKSYTKFGNFLY